MKTDAIKRAIGFISSPEEPKPTLIEYLQIKTDACTELTALLDGCAWEDAAKEKIAALETEIVAKDTVLRSIIEPNGSQEDMKTWCGEDAVLLDIPTAEIIQQLCEEVGRVRTEAQAALFPAKKARLVAAFPGCGKTWLFNHSHSRILDSDSSTFDKKGFPANYLSHIRRHLDKADMILISTHASVRAALVSAGMHFTLVYPRRDDKAEYISRYAQRGDNDAFVALLDTNWDGWMDEMDTQKGCHHIILEPGEFLSEALSPSTDKVLIDKEERDVLRSLARGSADGYVAIVIEKCAKIANELSGVWPEREVELWSAGKGPMGEDERIAFFHADKIATAIRALVDEEE